VLLWWLNGDARITPEREQEHAAMTSSLPLHHQDPFDRLLLAQARLEGLQLITADATCWSLALSPCASGSSCNRAARRLLLL
jgi:hypothetical protein